MELFKIVPFLIFSENNPMQEIPIIDKYTKGMIEWNPRKISVKIIQKIGNRKANFLFWNLWTANNAMPVIGATFGGWGNSLVITAKAIRKMIIKFLFILFIKYLL